MKNAQRPRIDEAKVAENRARMRRVFHPLAFPKFQLTEPIPQYGLFREIVRRSGQIHRLAVFGYDVSGAVRELAHIARTTHPELREEG